MLDRDGPIRSWASAVSSTPPKETTDGARAGRDRPLDTDDPVVRGVVSGGKVVDEWIRQAQQAARLLGGNPSPTAWADASGRMFRNASDLMAAWWGMLGIPMPNGAPAATAPPGANHDSAWQPQPAPHPPEGEPASQTPLTSPVSRTSGGPRVRIEVASRRPVEITIDVQKNGCAGLRVLDLRPTRGSAPRIRGITLEPSDAHGLHLRLTVPDKQPAGTYRAFVIDPATDSTVGTLTLRIGR
jgi:hypothetical protein